MFSKGSTAVSGLRDLGNFCKLSLALGGFG